MKKIKSVASSSFTPPEFIQIITDDSEAKFLKTEVTDKILHQYEYTQGIEKVGMTVKWEESYLIKMLQYSFKQKH